MPFLNDGIVMNAYPFGREFYQLAFAMGFLKLLALCVIEWAISAFSLPLFSKEG